LAVIDWLLTSGEPWTCYRALVDLLDRPESDAEVLAARDAMLTHPQVQALIATGAWPGPALRRHNDAGHPLYALATLADFGLKADDDRRLDAALDAILDHQSPEGAFQAVLNIAPAFGGSGQDAWTWALCDTPTLLYIVLAMGRGADPRVSRAVDHLVGAVAANGYRCMAAPELGKFHGPGRRSDPCPVANVYAVKALAQASASLSVQRAAAVAGAVAAAAEMLLDHWQRRAEVKYYLFGAGTDYGKLKYPFVWYDVLHVAQVLGECPTVRADTRFQDMLDAIEAQADAAGRYTAGSMYQAWKGWSFANKKQPSPWLTFCVLRIQRRLGR